LADWRSDADALDRQDQAADAEKLRRQCDAVTKSAEDYLTFLSEKEAVLWSGYSKVWLRQRFPAWQRLGHAKTRERGKGDRLYRRCVLPRRADLAAARANAVQTARAENA
jgi:hypothetical protein